MTGYHNAWESIAGFVSKQNFFFCMGRLLWCWTMEKISPKCLETCVSRVAKQKDLVIAFYHFPARPEGRITAEASGPLAKVVNNWWYSTWCTLTRITTRNREFLTKRENCKLNRVYNENTFLFISANILSSLYLVLEHRLSRQKLWFCSVLMHHLTQRTRSLLVRVQ